MQRDFMPRMTNCQACITPRSASVCGVDGMGSSQVAAEAAAPTFRLFSREFPTSLACAVWGEKGNGRQLGRGEGMTLVLGIVLPPISVCEHCDTSDVSGSIETRDPRVQMLGARAPRPLAVLTAVADETSEIGRPH